MLHSGWPVRTPRLRRALAALGWVSLIVVAGLYLDLGCTPGTVPPCTDDGPCAEGERCRDGQCVEDCTEDTCPDGEKCNQETGQCEADCNGPGTTCDPGKVCADSGICETFPCQQDPDSCSEGACDGSGNCVIVSCSSYVDCPSPFSQQCHNGVCEGLCGVGTCDENEVCLGGDCVDPSSLPADDCKDDEDCDPGSVCKGDKCVKECVSKGCVGALACHVTIGCQVVLCTTDADCPDTRKTGCNTVNHTCEVRSDGGACPAGSTVNGQGLCTPTPCVDDGDCSGSKCAIDSGLCPVSCPPGEGVCLPSCAVDGCPPGTECNPVDGNCDPDSTFLTAPGEIVQLSDPNLGAPTELQVSLAVSAGDLQVHEARVHLGTGLGFDGFEAPGRPAGSVVGTVEADFGSGSVPVHDILALDAGTAYIDVDGNALYDPGLDVVARSTSPGGELTLAVTAPKGGDLDSSLHELDQSADVALHFISGVYGTVGAGLETVSARLVSVDPDTGGRRNYLRPDPEERTFEDTLAICNKTFVSGVTGLEEDWETAGHWDPATTPGGTDFVCVPPGSYAQTTVQSSVSVVGVSSEPPLLCGAGCDLTADQDSEVTSLTLQDGAYHSAAGRLRVRGSLTVAGAAQLDADTVIEEGASLDFQPGALVLGEIDLLNRGSAVWNGDAAVVEATALRNEPGASLTFVTAAPLFTVPVDNAPGAAVHVEQPSTLFVEDNDGSIDSTAPGTVVLTGYGAPDVSSGSFSVAAGGTLELRGPWEISGSVGGAGTVRVATGTATLRGTTDPDRLEVGSNGTAFLESPLTVSELEVTGPLAVLDGPADVTVTGPASLSQASLHGSAVLELQGATSIADVTLEARDTRASAGFELTGDLFLLGAPLRVSGATQLPEGARIFGYSGAGVENRGALVASPTTFVPVADGDGAGGGDIWVQTSAGSTEVDSGLLLIDGDGTHEGTYDVQPGATLALQNGRHSFRADATNAGTLRVQTAQLQVHGVRSISGPSGTFDAGGATLEFVLRGPAPGDAGGYDQLQIEGAADLDLATVVARREGFTPQDGDTFDLMLYGSRTGTLDAVQLPPLPLGLAFSVTEGPTELRLKVVPASQALDVEVVVLDSPTVKDEPVAVHVVVTNTGATALDNLTVDLDVLGADFDLDDVIPESGSCDTALPAHCELGPLSLGGRRDVALLVTPRATGDLTADVTVQESVHVPRVIEVRDPATVELPTMYAVAGNGSSLVRGGEYIHRTSTGEVVALVRDLTASGGVTGLAIQDESTAYATTIQGFGTTSNLLQVDLTGATPPVTVGPVTLSGTPISVGDLAFQPGTQKLFGIRAYADGASLGGELVTLNLITAEATLVGVSDGYEPGGIAFAPDGTLYQTTTVPTLRVLDPADAATVSEIPLSRYYDGLGHRDPQGDLFASGGGTLWRIDKASGLEIELVPGPGGALSDVDFLPGPPETLLTFASDAALSLTVPSTAVGFDVVRGDLATLRSSAGDFSVAVEACVADDTATPSVATPEDPAPGAGFFWVARVVVTDGHGSYDAHGATQAAPRDLPILASGNDCP